MVTFDYVQELKTKAKISEMISAGFEKSLKDKRWLGSQPKGMKAGTQAARSGFPRGLQYWSRSHASLTIC